MLRFAVNAYIACLSHLIRFCAGGAKNQTLRRDNLTINTSVEGQRLAPPTINQGRAPRATSLTCKSARKIILGRVAKGPVHRLLLILLTGERYISISVSDSEVIELSCPPQRGVFWLMIVMCWPAARLHAVTECVHVIPPTDFTTLFTLFTLFSLTS